jgi:hypothetical protein
MSVTRDAQMYALGFACGNAQMRQRLVPGIMLDSTLRGIAISMQAPESTEKKLATRTMLSQLLAISETGDLIDAVIARLTTDAKYEKVGKRLHEATFAFRGDPSPSQKTQLMERLKELLGEL